MAKIKVAVIGVGNIAHSHIQAYLSNPDVELYAFCDINEERLYEMGKIYNVTRLYTEESTMLAELPEIDAVSVCTWNNAHAECSIMALEAGKNVLCEKPMAMNEGQAREMLKASKESGRHLQIGFVCRFEQSVSVIQDFQKHDYFGDFYYAKAVYLRRNGSPGGWFSDKERSSGGPLIDLGVHVIDLTRYLMGNPKPVSVYAVTFDKIKDRPGVYNPDAYKATSGDQGVFNVEDLAVALIKYENGAALQVETSYSLNMKEDIYSQELFGTKGGVKLEPQLEFYTDQFGYMVNTQPAYHFTEDGLFEREINHFIDCIQGKTECIAPAEDGVMIMKILDAIYESAEKGHEVLL